MTNRINSSPSPSSRPFSDKISAIGAKISRTLSSDRTLAGSDPDRSSLKESAAQAQAHAAMIGSEKGPDSTPDRSVSRGREFYQSSGRGGIGNIRSTSTSRDATRPDSGPDDFSRSRGREPGPAPTVQLGKNFSTGRGGAGNIRSPSRDVADSVSRSRGEEERIIRAHEAAELDLPHSTGRGGAGNIAPRSISRGRAQVSVHSTGRGGAGNIVSSSQAGDALAAQAEEEERKRRHGLDGIHSTGRGGVANLTTAHEPGIERVTHHLGPGDLESRGRGGVGNIVASRSVSGTRNDE